MSPKRRGSNKAESREASQSAAERRIWRVFEYRRPAPIVRPRFTA
jgi:hypothetical protein